MAMRGTVPHFGETISWKPTMKRPKDHKIAAGGSTVLSAWVESEGEVIYTFPSEMFYHFHGPGECSDSVVELGGEEFIFNYDEEKQCIYPEQLRFKYACKAGDLDHSEQQRKDDTENKKKQMLGELCQKIAEKQSARQLIAQQMQRIDEEIERLQTHFQRLSSL